MLFQGHVHAKVNRRDKLFFEREVRVATLLTVEKTSLSFVLILGTFRSEDEETTSTSFPF